jgi:tripartite-type tricarboxylate transporter receptor subunit TctC
MVIHRRELLRLAWGTAAVAVWPQAAWADTYPSHPVRILVGYAAGGGVDIAARLIGQWLSERLQQQFVVENRTGAATNIATEAAVRSPPDGYTLLLVNAANAINATYYENLSFNFMRDIAPVAGIGCPKFRQSAIRCRDSNRLSGTASARRPVRRPRSSRRSTRR